jgi:hypothetical protein
MPPKNQYDISQRAQAVTLLVIGSNFDYITSQTGISKRQVQYYLATAKHRGIIQQSLLYSRMSIFVTAYGLAGPKQLH